MSAESGVGFSANHPKLVVPDSRVSFPACERDCIKYWDEIKAFQTQLKLSEGKPEFTFYDGPPFATGLPHYGHLLAGTIKDVVTRYASQTGHHVSRRFGWDTHGLPVEHEVDKMLNIKTKDDIMKMGIGKYNDACRSIVLRYTAEWEKTVVRLGRWIDFKDGYRTMDLSFMESVWWVFKSMWEKGLVYRGFKVMPYSTALTTPLSNFEANLNYKEVHDPAVSITFPIVGDEEKAEFVAWTTTPWTLPSNLALCVNPTMTYVRVRDLKTQRVFVLAKARMGELFTVPKIQIANVKSTVAEEDREKAAKAEEEKAKAAFLAKLPVKTEQYEILKEMVGTDLKDLCYVPLFDYFAEAWKGTAFRVIVDPYVTDDSGTGVVHCAPAFGEDDYRVCLANGVVSKDSVSPCPIDDSGKFTEDIVDYKGVYVKDADPLIIKELKNRSRVVKVANILHKYPYCWRSETPLLYRTVPSWFVSVETIKARLLNSNEQTYWVPAQVKEGRFHMWLRDARDWAISRSRYWGTPLPIWLSEDGTQTVVIGSVAELEAKSGVTGITDIHKDKIDDVTIPDPRGDKYPPLRKVPDVFDCWFESGSMPYAQLHYPFENKEVFEKGFPADFIAEGLDQTRGWFYTLMVLSTALFDKPAFKNCIVNGLVLAADGKKMSKRLKNYPDPNDVVETYGADALRLYLINSPVVRALPVAFKEEGVKQVVKSVLLPWWNAFRFCIENIIRADEDSGKQFVMDEQVLTSSTNVMDRWILAALQTLIEEVRREMDAYRLYTVVPILLKFIEQLTNWYVRSNRRRFKAADLADRHKALSTLTYVLLQLCKLMAPFTPFITETMYQHLKLALPASQQVDSVHFLDVPTPVQSARDPAVELAIQRMQTVIDLARVARTKRDISLKVPLRSLTVGSDDAAVLKDVQGLEEYVKDEINVCQVIYENKLSSFMCAEVKPNRKALGPKLGSRLAEITSALAALTVEQIEAARANGLVEVCGVTISYADLEVNVKLTIASPSLEFAAYGGVAILLDLTPDKALALSGCARELVNRVQRMRKSAGLTPSDKVEVFAQYGTTLSPSEIPPDATKALLTMDIPAVAIGYNSTIQAAIKAAKQQQSKAAAGSGEESKAAPSSSYDDDSSSGSSDVSVTLEEVFAGADAQIRATLLQPINVLSTAKLPAGRTVLYSEVVQVAGEWVKLTLTRLNAYVNTTYAPVPEASATFVGALTSLVQTLPYDTVVAAFNSGKDAPAFNFKLDGVDVQLVPGRDVFLTYDAAMQAGAKVL